MQKQKIIFIILVVGIVAGVIYTFQSKTPREPEEGIAGETEETDKEAVSDDAKIVTGSAPNHKIVTMTISKNGYNPDEVVVEEGDVVTFNITAVDGTYDVFLSDLNLYQSVKKGSFLGFGFDVPKAGVFTYTCRDFCPAGKKISGTLTVR